MIDQFDLVLAFAQSPFTGVIFWVLVFIITVFGALTVKRGSWLDKWLG